MTPEDRDAIRAEASMRILAALNTGYQPRQPKFTQPELLAEYRKGDDERRMKLALEAALAANALIAELEVHEEATGISATDYERLAAATGAHILHCKHGKASFEDCAACDAEDEARVQGELAEMAAEESGKSGEGGEEPTKPA
jgi:hypothetical protein